MPESQQPPSIVFLPPPLPLPPVQCCLRRPSHNPPHTLLKVEGGEQTK